MWIIARIAYRRERDDSIVAERTETSPQFDGVGVELALVERMVEDARREKREDLCASTFVDEQRRTHPEWADVFQV